MIPFSGGRNLPDHAARDRHVCLSVRNVDCGRFRRYCKSSGRKVRAACIRLTVLPIRRSIGYRSLHEKANRSTISGDARPRASRPSAFIRNAGREIFRLGPRKFHKFRAHVKLCYVRALSAFLIATQEISERHSFQRRNWKEGEEKG